MLKVFLISSLVALASCFPQRVGKSIENNEIEDNNPSYTFEYKVADNEEQVYQAHQQNMVDSVVNGEYSWVDPVGTLHLVRYRADDTGFHIIDMQQKPGFVQITPKTRKRVIVKKKKVPADAFRRGKSAEPQPLRVVGLSSRPNAAAQQQQRRLEAERRAAAAEAQRQAAAAAEAQRQAAAAAEAQRQAAAAANAQRDAAAAAKAQRDAAAAAKAQRDAAAADKALREAAAAEARRQAAAAEEERLRLEAAAQAKAEAEAAAAAAEAERQAAAAAEAERQAAAAAAAEARRQAAAAAQADRQAAAAAEARRLSAAAAEARRQAAASAEARRQAAAAAEARRQAAAAEALRQAAALQAQRQAQIIQPRPVVPQAPRGSRARTLELFGKSGATIVTFSSPTHKYEYKNQTSSLELLVDLNDDLCKELATKEDSLALSEKVTKLVAKQKGY